MSTAGRGRILVAGIGNVFFGDDAFGVEVIERLRKRSLPQGVELMDAGIRGLDLTYALLDGYDAVVWIDAAPRGGEPGTLYVIEPDLRGSSRAPADGASPIDTHGMTPGRVLSLVQQMGGTVPTLRIVACEPAPLTGDAEMHMGLSAAVEAAVDEAVPLVESVLRDLATREPARA